MCNHSDLSTIDDSDKNSDSKMLIVDESKEGPFAGFASDQVLSRLGGFQDSVDSSYRQSLPQDKVSLQAAGIDWKDIYIENVLGEGGFSWIFKVSIEQS